jgi:putative protease
MQQGIDYAHHRGRRVFIAINTYPQPAGWGQWQQAVDAAARLQVDALIIADLGVLDYATERWPGQPRHLSVQASATNPEAIAFYHEQFGIQRVVVPRVLSLRQVVNLVQRSPVAIEVFGFGSLCVMVEGRCLLSSYATGESPNSCGACSPARHVEWRETGRQLETRLGGILIDRYGADEAAGYPTLCKGRFQTGGPAYYALEEPTSLNSLELLPQLLQAGVQAIKLEGRQRSPAYIARVTRVWRAALDALHRDPAAFRPEPHWLQELGRVAEGAQTTLGAYHRPWQ